MKLYIFQATVSQGDFKVLMTLLNDNLSEGQKVDTSAGPGKVKDTETAQGEDSKKTDEDSTAGQYYKPLG